jgi:hypothetical protein
MLINYLILLIKKIKLLIKKIKLIFNKIINLKIYSYKIIWILKNDKTYLKLEKQY